MFAIPQTEDRLTVTFTRPLVTGDAHDWQITDEPVYLLYGYSDQPVRQGNYAKHRDFGITRAQLLDTNARRHPKEAAEAASQRGPPVLLLLAVAAAIALLAWRWMQRTRSVRGKAAASSSSKAADDDAIADDAIAIGTAARRRGVPARQTTAA